jgi:hypothetical protein
MLLEAIVGEFQALLGAVGPQIAVHAAMDRLAIFVEPGTPGVVPQSSPIALLLEADNLRDVRPLAGGRLECPKLRQSGRTCPDDGHALFHDFLPGGGAPAANCW